jgi:hypothetical protein
MTWVKEPRVRRGSAKVAERAFVRGTPRRAATKYSDLVVSRLVSRHRRRLGLLGLPSTSFEFPQRRQRGACQHDDERAHANPTGQSALSLCLRAFRVYRSLSLELNSLKDRVR